MRNNRISKFLLLMFVIGLTVFSNKRPPPSEIEVRSIKNDTPLPRQKQSERPKDIPSKNFTQKDQSRITRVELQSLRDSLPTVDITKEEVEKAPHQAPASLIIFAKRLGPLMEKGLKNSTDAELLSHELEECAMDSSIIQSARATCVVSLERLAKKYPELNVDAERIKNSVAPDVKKLLNYRDNQLR